MRHWNILESNLFFLVQSLEIEECWIFQWHNDPKYTLVKVTHKLFVQNNVEVFSGLVNPLIWIQSKIGNKSWKMKIIRGSTEILLLWKLSAMKSRRFQNNVVKYYKRCLWAEFINQGNVTKSIKIWNQYIQCIYPKNTVLCYFNVSSMNFSI